jgi:ABC-type Mn2+/Zn2+ transport system ATPase subunit
MTDDDGAIILKATDLRLGYGARTVLQGVNLAVRAGERWFIIGPNGQGKSTLMRAMLGQLDASGGRLERDPKAMSAGNIGFVPQHGQMSRTLPTTAGEFVCLGLVGLRVDRAERRRRLGEALATVGLEGKERADVAALSGGQRHRCLLARALIRRPGVLLMDEPTSGLDPAGEQALMATLVKLNRERGVTTLLVTHQLGLAARFGTHAALVYDGRAHAGPIAEILQPGKLREVYGVELAVGGGA